MVNSLPINAEYVYLTPQSGRFPGVRNVNALQYSYLENSIEREAPRARVHEDSKTWM